jgi:hypothetical protein
VFSNALEHLRFVDPEAVELLISAFGADRKGRPLTEAESVARQKYKEAVERECKWDKVRAPIGCERMIDIPDAIGKAFFSLSYVQELELIQNAENALLQGGNSPKRKPPPGENT